MLYDKAIRGTRWPAAPPTNARAFQIQRIVNPAERRLDTLEEIRDRILEAARYVLVDQLGTTDDSGFASFDNGISVTRSDTFKSIRHRVLGTALATEEIYG